MGKSKQKSLGPQKVHTTALCYIPPVSVQPAIQGIRQQHDKQYDRWPPHINLLYPFVPLDEFEDAATRLKAALQTCTPFAMALNSLQLFRHSKKSFLAWLDPKPSDAGRGDAWQLLQALCLQQFPHCTDMTVRGEFVPHLTVGQFGDESRLTALQADMKRSWEPLAIQVSELCLISRASDDEPFFVYWRVGLGNIARREDPPCLGVGRDPTAVHAAVPLAAPSAAAAEETATNQVRVTVASNAKRSVRSIVLVAARAELAQLRTSAKNKLRLSCNPEKLVFYREGGAVLREGERIAQGELILVSKGEPYVGALSTAAIGSNAANGSVSTLPPLEPASGPGYMRIWRGERHENGLRLMQWNILAGILASGIRDSVAQDLAELSDSRTASERWCGVCYRSSHAARAKERHTFLCDHTLLDWQRRAPLVAREIVQAAPTLLCLQEVDASQMTWLRALLEPRGYAFAIGDAQCQTHCVALFWDTNVVVAVGEPQAIGISLRGQQTLLVQRLQLLQCPRGGGALGSGEGGDCGGPATFILATTHLKAGCSAQFETERAKQVANLLKSLQHFRGTSQADEPVVLAGDLNAHPTLLLADNDGEALEALAVPQLVRAGFRCAYGEATGETPSFTHWAGWSDREVKTSFDHVLLHGTNVTATAALQMPASADIHASHCRLPNEDYPSDHVSLVVELAFPKA